VPEKPVQHLQPALAPNLVGDVLEDDRVAQLGPRAIGEFGLLELVRPAAAAVCDTEAVVVLAGDEPVAVDAVVQ